MNGLLGGELERRRAGNVGGVVVRVGAGDVNDGGVFLVWRMIMGVSGWRVVGRQSSNNIPTR